MSDMSSIIDRPRYELLIGSASVLAVSEGIEAKWLFGMPLYHLASWFFKSCGVKASNVICN
ncbi:hypothetical protein YQE_08688, partial [Dendroctonus ponderosae]